MSSSKQFVEYVCSNLSSLGNITYRPMMGEYLIYVNGKYCLAVCDDTVFLKPTDKVRSVLREVIEESMYPGAKASFLINDIDDKEYFCSIVSMTYDNLPEPKKKK